LHACLSFSADGTRLAAGLSDSTAIVWDLNVLRSSAGPTNLPHQQEDCEKRWAELADENAAKAYAACCALASEPVQAVAFLQNRLRALATPDPKWLAQRITDLDDKQFAVRQKALEELTKIRRLAEPAVREALRHNPTPEQRQRLQALLAHPPTLVDSNEELRQLRAIQVLEWIGTPEAREVLGTLAQGAPLAIETVEASAALDRLNRRAFQRH
jgi:hypothetical protein